MAIACAAPPIDTRRHHRGRVRDPRAGRAAAMVVTGVARLGSLVTLLAVLVLGGALAVSATGNPSAGHDTTLTVTFDGAGH